MCFDLDKRSAFTRILFKHHTTPDVHARINTTHCFLWASDFDQENRFLESWFSCHLGRKHHTAKGGHNLTSASVNGICMHGNVHKIEADAAHVLFAQGALFGTPLEGTVHMILDFKEILHTLSLICDNVGAFSFWSPAPDLTSRVFIPIKFFTQNLGPFFRI